MSVGYPLTQTGGKGKYMGDSKVLVREKRDSTGKDATPLGQHLVNNPPKISPGFSLIHSVYLQDEKRGN